MIFNIELCICESCFCWCASQELWGLRSAYAPAPLPLLDPHSLPLHQELLRCDGSQQRDHAAEGSAPLAAPDVHLHHANSSLRHAGFLHSVLVALGPEKLPSGFHGALAPLRSMPGFFRVQELSKGTDTQVRGCSGLESAKSLLRLLGVIESVTFSAVVAHLPSLGDPYKEQQPGLVHGSHLFR